MDTHRDSLIPIAFLLLCCMILYSAGCSRLRLFQQPAAAKVQNDIQLEQYQLGINAYLDQDYSTAAKLLLTVVDQTTDPVLARKALMGLACAHFMMADNEAAFRVALDYWQAWLSAAPRDWAVENPLLFDPIVKRKLVVPGEHLNAPQHQAGEHVQHSIIWNDTVLMDLLEDELAKVKAQLKEAKQHALQQQDAIQALEQENAKLKKQIKAIEIIDQKIQEKKTAVPSTK